MIENEKSEVALIQKPIQTRTCELEHETKEHRTLSGSEFVSNDFTSLSISFKRHCTQSNFYFLLSLARLQHRARFSPLFSTGIITQLRVVFFQSLFNRLYLCTRAHDSHTECGFFFFFVLSTLFLALISNTIQIHANDFGPCEIGRKLMAVSASGSVYCILSGFTIWSICQIKSESL